MPTFAKAVDRIFAEASRVLMAKRKAKGTQNITNQGFYGVIIRLAEDKMARLKKGAEDILLRGLLEQRGASADWVPVPDQGKLIDDLLDTINYAVIAITLLRDQWADREPRSSGRCKGEKDPVTGQAVPGEEMSYD